MLCRHAAAIVVCPGRLAGLLQWSDRAVGSAVHHGLLPVRRVKQKPSESETLEGEALSACLLDRRESGVARSAPSAEQEVSSAEQRACHER
jgi:hypothetical protein